MSAEQEPPEAASGLVVVDRAAAAPAAIATIEKLQAAVQRGEITAKFARGAGAADPAGQAADGAGRAAADHRRGVLCRGLPGGDGGGG
jgi:hypothetical protein